MNIGIIGSGHIGGTLARLFVEAGHQIAISNSRGPASLQELVSELGGKARALDPAGAASFGEVVILATPLKSFTTLPAAELRGKIAVDAMNYYSERDGRIAALDSGETTSSEMVARHLPGVRVVKAFNTIWFEHLRKQGDTARPIDGRRAIFISGDDAAAKAAVASLIEDIGFGAVDLGSLRHSAAQQPGAAMYNRDITAGDARTELRR